MFGFGRKKQQEADSSTPLEGKGEAQEAEQAQQEQSAEQEQAQQEQISEQAGASFERTQGPWDISEQKITNSYIDLGGLLVKSNPGLSLRLEADQKSQQIIALTLQLGEGTLQVQAFAAPKSRGLWDEIRQELADSVQKQGGQADETPGPFGPQLLTRVPAQMPDGRKGYRIARFVGVDGPRWFMRGVFTGKAVAPGQVASDLEEVFRSLVVNRGSAPMPPRDLLPMRVPAALAEAAQTQNQPAGAQAEAKKVDDEKKPSLEVPRRGPEITEIG